MPVVCRCSAPAGPGLAFHRAPGPRTSPVGSSQAWPLFPGRVCVMFDSHQGCRGLIVTVVPQGPEGQPGLDGASGLPGMKGEKV